ncbi:MAG: bifunctional glutamate N-acetyltransferase/amino-acid acetyltransferase ArgJ [Phycisphaeraceae bacterium]|nr:bifunctional glutamate N-acetyltransferase/amino-acid acetyltransferase ArgJ [Phycisphaeraceae bacterium]
MANLYNITAAKGFRTGGTTCGIKASGKPDLMIITSDSPCSVAGVFTTNKMPGAPVVVSKRHVRNGKAQAIVCNSGISNVCTGPQGLADALTMCLQTGEQLGIDPADVLVCSTGVIGHMLPMGKIEAGIEKLAPKLAKGPKADSATARAIMTTDLVPKSSLIRLQLGSKTIHMGGIAKGSGMIAPNMATMLSFITTDIAITPILLKQVLKRAADVSYNRISIDDDTSTSDSVLILANGQAGNRLIDKPGKNLDAFEAALTTLCKDLAYQIVKDGEGATRVYRAQISGAASLKDANRNGKTIANSPLVKTAIHGNDPNWGRLVMAVGRSGAKVKPDKLDIGIGGILLCKSGEPVQLTKAQLAKIIKHMKSKEVLLTVNLNLGQGEAQWLGCDLSREYITINADYTT